METVWLVLHKDMQGYSNGAAWVFKTEAVAREWISDHLQTYFSNLSGFWGEDNFGRAVYYAEKGDSTLFSFTIIESEVIT